MQLLEANIYESAVLIVASLISHLFRGADSLQKWPQIGA